MTYTYDDFVTAANNAGIMNQFSQQDLTVAKSNPEYGMSMLGLLQDISGATTEEQRLLATEAANQMRKNYGTYNAGSGTADRGYASAYGGTVDDLLGQINGYGSFGYDGQDDYQKLLDSIVSQQPFSYDIESDPSWGSYKKAYMREGDRASANALAQASAASGGRASSYAMTAAQQAGNYYAGQLADIIPTLEKNAYDRYLSDFSKRLNSLGAIENDRAFDYQRWINEYNMLQNSLGNYQGQDATDYQRFLDEYEQRYRAEQDEIARQQQAFENALASYQILGYATPEVAEILGIKAGSGSSDSGETGGADGEILLEEPVGETGTEDEILLEEPIGPEGGDDDGGDDYTIDMRSVVDLGYGMIDEAELDRLVKAGEIREVVDGNVIRFEKVQKNQPTKTEPEQNKTPNGLPLERIESIGTSVSSGKAPTAESTAKGSSKAWDTQSKKSTISRRY